MIQSASSRSRSFPLPILWRHWPAENIQNPGMSPPYRRTIRRQGFYYQPLAADQGGAVPGPHITGGPHQGEEKGILDHPKQEEKGKDPPGEMTPLVDQEKGRKPKRPAGNLKKKVPMDYSGRPWCLLDCRSRNRILHPPFSPPDVTRLTLIIILLPDAPRSASGLPFHSLQGERKWVGEGDAHLEKKELQGYFPANLTGTSMVSLFSGEGI